MFYRALVLVHVAAVFGFLLAHGTPVFVAFRIRSERNPDRLRTLLETSRDCVGLIHLSLFLVVVTGIALAFFGSWWGHGWIWASMATLVLIWIAMWLLGTRHYDRARLASGATTFYRVTGAAPAAPSQPFVMSAIGGTGLVVLLWLMLFKPF